MKFNGTFEELKSKTSIILGEWVDLNANQKQFRTVAGGVINWWPSTGTLQIQGKLEVKGQLEEKLHDLLNSKVEENKIVINTQSDRNVVENIPKIEEKKIEIPPQSTEKSEETIQVEEKVSTNKINYENSFLGNSYDKSEVVIALVGAVGTNLDKVDGILKNKLENFYKYNFKQIRISSDIIEKEYSIDNTNAYTRINTLIDGGNYLREASGDNSILSLGAAKKINTLRVGSPNKNAYIIHSLKHPEEIQRLREIYTTGVYVISVYSDAQRRASFLKNEKNIQIEDYEKLMIRDEDESLKHGQHTRDTFHMADFFVDLGADSDKLQNDIWRILEIIFGSPYKTPTFDEFAMFMAFSSSLRSADLSRQVGAVISKNNQIISTGANDIPKFGGGLYWSEYDENTKKIEDKQDGRDYMRGEDSNSVEKKKIIDSILSNIPTEYQERVSDVLKNSGIKDLTEYGRVVHAEMEAILSCARNNISTQDTTLFCTTFPCHNCAKHIISSGIKKVLYVEPYPKSKALEFHSDSITTAEGEDNFVLFKPFVGVGPKSFYNLFSMNQGVGYPLKRKTKEGTTVEWKEENSKLRIQLLPYSYLEREEEAKKLFEGFNKKN